MSVVDYWAEVEFPAGYECRGSIADAKHKAIVIYKHEFAFTLQRRTAKFYPAGKGIGDHAVVHSIHNRDRQQLVAAACTYHKLMRRG